MGFCARKRAVARETKIEQRIEAANPMDPLAWEIGPVIDGKTYSEGMPPRPMLHGDGWCFDFPQSPRHVNALTFKHGSLAGKSTITLRFRIEMAEGVKIVPKEAPDWPRPATLSLYFQRAGDDWSGNGKYETYRWFSGPAQELVAGEHVFSMPFSAEWGAIRSSSNTSNVSAFREAMDNAERIGFGFGGGPISKVHGAHATGAARFVMTGFEVV